MHLIDKNKIDIYDIPIASLTEQYIEYLDRYRSFNHGGYFGADKIPYAAASAY